MSSETSSETEKPQKTRRELNQELLIAVEKTKAETRRPYLTARMGNEIRICDWRPTARYCGSVLHTYKVFGPDEIEQAIAYVRSMKPLGENY